VSKLNNRIIGAIESLEYMRRFVESLQGDVVIRERILREINLLIRLLLTRRIAEYEARISRYDKHLTRQSQTQLNGIWNSL
jgi:hypothetical protein